MRRIVLLLALLGCSGEPDAPLVVLRVSEQSLDFGQIRVERTFTRRLDVRNDGVASLEIAPRTDDDAFSAFPSRARISPGEEQLRVRFVPPRVGRYAASLRFETNATVGATTTITLMGAGFCTGLGCPPTLDAGVRPDAGGDAGGAPDAGPFDAGVEPDTGMVPDAGVDTGVDPDAGVPPDSGVPPDTGAMPELGARYRFEEASGPLLDLSGHGNDGVPSAQGLMRGVAGQAGNAVRFDGTVGQFSVPADPSLDVSTGMTVQMFVNLSAGNQQMTLLGRGDQTNEDGVFISTTCNNVVARFSRTGVGGAATATTQCDTLTVGNWTHLAVANDGTSVVIYLDGNVAATGTGGYLGAIPNALVIGRREPGLEPFNGLIDELSWWTIARDQPEICVDAGGTFLGNGCQL